MRLSNYVGRIREPGRDQAARNDLHGRAGGGDRLGDRGVDAALDRPVRAEVLGPDRHAAVRRLEVLEAVARVEAALERDDEVRGQVTQENAPPPAGSPPAPRGAG